MVRDSKHSALVVAVVVMLDTGITEFQSILMGKKKELRAAIDGFL